MGTQRGQMKETFLGWFVGLVVPVQAIFVPALAALVGPVQNYFLTTRYFNFFVPMPFITTDTCVIMRNIILW
jgi:hypothetical protein